MPDKTEDTVTDQRLLSSSGSGTQKVTVTAKKPKAKAAPKKSKSKKSTKAKAAPETKAETKAETKPAKKAERKPKGAPLELIVDPLEQKVVDNGELIHKALVAVDEALTSEEEAHAPDMMAARLLFQSSQYATPFRFLIGLAYSAGKKS